MSELVGGLHFETHILRGLLQIAAGLGFSEQFIAFLVEQLLQLVAVYLGANLALDIFKRRRVRRQHIHHVGDDNLVARQHYRLRDLTLLERNQGSVEILIDTDARNRVTRSIAGDIKYLGFGIGGGLFGVGRILTESGDGLVFIPLQQVVDFLVAILRDQVGLASSKGMVRAGSFSVTSRM